MHIYDKYLSKTYLHNVNYKNKFSDTVWLNEKNKGSLLDTESGHLQISKLQH